MTASTSVLCTISTVVCMYLTGTDTDAFAYSNEGVPSMLISLPLRYMHTTVEMCRKEDVENTIRLIYEALQTIKKSQDFRYMK